MRDSTVFDCKLIPLPQVGNRNGYITAINSNLEVPFETKRVYYLYDIPGGESRAAHGHKELQQLIIAASGSFDITLDDGKNKKTINMLRPNVGLYMKAGIWRDLSNFSSGAICLVLASFEYSEEDYLRNYDEFLAFKNIK
ncbi:MAG: WxcM-like domain-containing protein [Bacteroidetes bacterium]|nr:WxcM-like domain-containing protein [Bacteroidota bacterium]